VQLTARCARFLEVSKPRSRSLFAPNCCVLYFHRTARGFLEKESVKESGSSKLSAKRTEADFNPYLALMRSCILTFQSKPLLMEINKHLDPARSHLCRDTSLARYMMFYAYHADLHTETKEAQIALLDKFSSLMLFYGYKYTPWMKDANFLELATLFDLRGYVSSKLSQIPQLPQRSKKATELLRLLVVDREQRAASTSPLLSADMGSLLLEQGADPNGRTDDLLSP
jgi:hypothetical protein